MPKEAAKALIAGIVRKTVGTPNPETREGWWFMKRVGHPFYPVPESAHQELTLYQSFYMRLRFSDEMMLSPNPEFVLGETKKLMIEMAEHLEAEAARLRERAEA